MSELGPLVLPYTEQLRYGWSVIRKKLLLLPSHKGTYMPNFKKALEHFCIHASGRGVLDGIVDSLKLHKEDREPSRMTFHKWALLFGGKGKGDEGNLVWQIAFGSGFKCNSAVWKCISDIDPTERNAWSDRVDSYPVNEIPNATF
ncbi:hypothetical protein GBA52_000179 [Prunus armeniaca]|nr:hypothetical protein GBA52_000179 [Prunus armeniaca]